MEAELPADQMVFAFQRWDQQVGSRVGKWRTRRPWMYCVGYAIE